MTTPDRSRWMHALLIASVAANVFLCAFLGVQAWQRQRLAERVAPPLAESFLNRLMGRLSPADQDVLRDAFSRRRPELAALQRQVREAMDRARADTARRPFDLAAARADIGAVRQRRGRITALYEEALLAALPRMSDEGRLALSQQRLTQR